VVEKFGTGLASSLPVSLRLRRRRADAALSGAVPKSNSQNYPVGTESTWAGSRLRDNRAVQADAFFPEGSVRIKQFSEARSRNGG
jgi:hypothetical protein